MESVDLLTFATYASAGIKGKADIHWIAAACTEMGSHVRAIEFLMRAGIAEDGIAARARPKKAAAAKKQKALAQYDELHMAFENYRKQMGGQIDKAMKKTASEKGVSIDTVRRARKRAAKKQ
jgi:hypothetical protein